MEYDVWYVSHWEYPCPRTGLSSLRSGDIVYVHLPLQPTIVLGSVQAAMDLLDKRSALYSSRQTLVMDGLSVPPHKFCLFIDSLIMIVQHGSSTLALCRIPLVGVRIGSTSMSISTLVL